MDTVVSSSSLLSIPPPLTSVRSSLTSTSYYLPTTKFSLNLYWSKKRSFWFYTRKKQLGPSSSSSKFSFADIQEINETQFEEAVLKSELPVLVEFVATWCGPCRLISPAMEWLAEEYKERLTVVRIDHDANPRLIEEYKVYGLPALIIFKNGQEVTESRREGAITKVKLKEYVDAFLESVSVA